MMTDIVDVQGKLAKFDLESGIPLTSGMIVDSAEQLSAIGSIAALSIPRGLVAVSIPINRLSSVSYAPRPGDHVNVIVSIQLVDLDTDFQTILPNNAGVVIAPGVEGELGTNYLTVRIDRLGAGPEDIGKLGVVPGLDQPQYSVPSEKQRPRLVSQNLLQDAIVLGVGNFPLEDEEPEEAVPVVDEQTDEGQPPAEGEQPVETPAPVPPDVITLIVSPQDAITLNYLIFSGAQMTLALRPSEDDTRVQTDAVTLQYLLDTYSIPVPVRLPYGMEPRVDALGGATSKYEDVQPTPVP
jgi:pilus assembly protein CpaB